MLFIFGVGERAVSLGQLLFHCEECGSRTVHHVYKRVRKVSLFFIPLIPAGTRHFDECTACGRTREVTRQQAESAMADPQAHLR